MMYASLSSSLVPSGYEGQIRLIWSYSNLALPTLMSMILSVASILNLCLCRCKRRREEAAGGGQGRRTRRRRKKKRREEERPFIYSVIYHRQCAKFPISVVNTCTVRRKKRKEREKMSKNSAEYKESSRERGEGIWFLVGP